MEDRKYYIVKNKALALGLAYITQEAYYQYDHSTDADKKVYSFKYTNKFKEALWQVFKLKEEIENIKNR